MKCPIELSNKLEVKLHRLFADLLTPDQVKGAENQPLCLQIVGMTGLEPATSRPPDACANQLRYIPSLFAGAKVHTYYDICKLLGVFLHLQRKYLLNTHILKRPKASSDSRMH